MSNRSLGKLIRKAILLTFALILSLSVCYVFRDIIREEVELFFLSSYPEVKDSSFEMPKIIAHAGGDFNGRIYTNSLQALNQNYQKGYRFFELDFCWTSDRKLAAIHDWHGAVESLSFGNAPVGERSERDFMSLSTSTNLNHLTLSSLSQWLREKPDAFIITDIKRDNVEGMTLTARNCPEVITQFIPQVYRFPEYRIAKELGFRNIILTLYRSRYTDDGIVEFSKNARPFGITMAPDRAISELPAKLSHEGIPSFCHGTSDPEVKEEAIKKGVFGFYSHILKE